MMLPAEVPVPSCLIGLVLVVLEDILVQTTLVPGLKFTVPVLEVVNWVLWLLNRQIVAERRMKDQTFQSRGIGQILVKRIWNTGNGFGRNICIEFLKSLPPGEVGSNSTLPSGKLFTPLKLIKITSRIRTEKKLLNLMTWRMRLRKK